MMIMILALLSKADRKMIGKNLNLFYILLGIHIYET